jgi:hypothetical protein
MVMTATPETKRWHHDGDRYEFDFGPCEFRQGWAQIDTSQDASYFGQWANPIKLIIFSFVEGDCCLIRCESREEFAAEIRKMRDWNTDNGYRFAIDGMCQQPIISAFEQMGLGDLLH